MGTSDTDRRESVPHVHSVVSITQVHPETPMSTGLTRGYLMARNRKKNKLLVIDYSGNPTHYGHLRCGKWMVAQAGFAHVLYAVSGSPATKSRSDVLDPEVRYELAVAATAGDRELSASRVNLWQPGMSWALTAVDGLEQQFPNAEVSFGISGEYLDPNHRWWLKNWIGGAELFKRSVATIFPRGNQTVEQLRDWAKLVPDARIDVHYAPDLPVSATQIRDLVKQGRSIRYLTADAVVDLINNSTWFRGVGKLATQVFDASKPVQSVCLFLAEFDPITFGDLRRAEIAREKYKFDRVEFIPVAGPSQTMKTFAPAEIRYEMALAATTSNPYFAASRFDIDYDENSYPLFTSVLVHRKYMKAERPDWMVYADWLNPEHSSWIGAWIGAPAVWFDRTIYVLPTKTAGAAQAREWAMRLPGARIAIVDAQTDTASAGDVRQWVSSRLPLAYSVPQAVENFIYKNGLYRPNGFRGRVALPANVSRHTSSVKTSAA